MSSPMYIILYVYMFVSRCIILFSIYLNLYDIVCCSMHVYDMLQSSTAVMLIKSCVYISILAVDFICNVYLFVCFVFVVFWFKCVCCIIIFYCCVSGFVFYFVFVIVVLFMFLWEFCVLLFVLFV